MQAEKALPRLLTLERWAQHVFGDGAPHMNTVRRWARDGMLYPAPIKMGRTYYVRPETSYSGRPDQLSERIFGTTAKA